MIDPHTMNILVAVIIAIGVGVPAGRWFADWMLRKGWWK